MLPIGPSFVMVPESPTYGLHDSVAARAWCCVLTRTVCREAGKNSTSCMGLRQYKEVWLSRAVVISPSWLPTATHFDHGKDCHTRDRHQPSKASKLIPEVTLSRHRH